MTTNKVPRGVQRPPFYARSRVHQVCTDDRNYTPYDFTLISPDGLAEADYEPARAVHRDSYVAKISVSCGKHDSGTHPDDGAVQGQALRLNVRRITVDESGDAALLSTDDIISVAVGDHHDSATDDETNFAISRINAHESLYIRVVQAPTSVGVVMVSVDLVPIRTVAEFS